MQQQHNTWRKWMQFFAERGQRQLPELEDVRKYADVPQSVARSLAIFQLGESGGGTIVKQARQSEIQGIDADYAEASRLFVAEEHRHAAILAICVRNLGGTLIRSNWTAKLFVFARRLIGLRLKVMVLLVAEVVGICYYHLLATRLPQSRVKSLLAQLVNDERAHFHFHCSFLRRQVTSQWQRLLFVVAWRSVMTAAAMAVLIDHRDALRDTGIGAKTVWRRWMSYGNLAERLVLNGPTTADEDRHILYDHKSNPDVANGSPLGTAFN